MRKMYTCTVVDLYKYIKNKWVHVYGGNEFRQLMSRSKGKFMNAD